MKLGNIIIDDDIQDDNNSIESDEEVDEESDEEIEIVKIEKKCDTPSIATLYNSYFNRNRINLRPNYQREFTWNFDKMCLFIDSIRKGYVIPLFILYQLSKEEKKEQSNKNIDFECVDGQHRLFVLKKYMDSEIINTAGVDKYIHWVDKKTKEKVFYKLTQEIKNKYKKGIREMTSDEIKDFEDTQFQFLIIQSKLSDEQKCEIFNRLQNGEKVNDVTKLKNINHPLTVYLRNNEIIKLDIIDKWKDIIVLKTNRTSHKSISSLTNNNINQLTYLLIRLFYVVDKKSLNINYLNINIKKYLEGNLPISHIKGDMDNIYKKINKTKDYISKHLGGEKIISELFIILAYITDYNKELITKLSNEKIRNDIIKKYNVISAYKTSNDKVISKENITKVCNVIIEKLGGQIKNNDIKNIETYSDTSDDEQIRQLSEYKSKNKSLKKSK